MKKKPNYREWQKPNPKRNKKILQLRKKKLTYRQIGEIVGLSQERVSQIEKKLSTL